MQKIRIENSGTAGLFWVFGWLFSLSFLQLTFWKGLLAILIWPYYLGDFIREIIK